MATRVGGDERRNRDTVTGVYVNVGKAMAAFERSRLPRRRAPVADGAACRGWPRPTYVKDEFRKYLECGDFSWLARRGLFREADASNEAPSYSAGEAMTLAGMPRGSPPTMISHASDCAATSRVQPSRWRAWACVATASWCTA